MINHIWSVLCRNAVIDIDTNNVSIHDILEQITINAMPLENGVLPFQFELITLWGRAESGRPTTGKSKVTLVAPSKKIKPVLVFEIDLSKAELFRQRVKFPGLAAGEGGIYHFVVELAENDNKWRQVAAIPLKISFKPEQITP